MWRTLRGFLTAEEVPRWFGLSLVLIYLVGLGAVAHYGILQARRESLDDVQRLRAYAVTALGEHLTHVAFPDEANPLSLGHAQRSLRDLALSARLDTVRVVDASRRVVASTEEMEIGTTLAEGVLGPVDPASKAVTTVDGLIDDRPVTWMRVPLTDATYISPVPVDLRPKGPAQLRPEDEGTPHLAYFLEACMPRSPVGPVSLANDAGALAVVLVVLGSLFFTYRCLREQMRGPSRVANRLRLCGQRIENDLASLRIAGEMDGVTQAWNELIDLTERLVDDVQRTEANEELSRVLERSTGGALSEALNALPDGLIYISDETRFGYVNATACRMFGWDPATAKEHTLPDAQARGVGGKVLDLLRQSLQDGGSFAPATEMVTEEERSEDDRSSYRVVITPLQRGGRKGECVAVVRDVSQQIRAERAREEFVTQVTHELRTPLTSIRAYAETLSSGMFEDPNVITECYNVITKETRRLSRLIEDILNVSQLDVGTIELQPGDVDIRTLMSDSVRDVRGLADEKSIDIQLVLPPKLETIQGDRDKLAVVVNNLLGNAIKYTPDGGIVVLGCQFTSESVVLTFKDNGIGIDPADHARVFEKFQRATDPDVQCETGTGIGLYTAREIVRRHGGDIELMSEKGHGSTFVVRLPHKEGRASAMSSEQEV